MSAKIFTLNKNKFKISKDSKLDYNNIFGQMLQFTTFYRKG